MLSREQVRAARAARGWGVRELGEAAGISFPTISAFENGADSRKGTLDRIEVTLKAEGFRFTNGDNPGVSWDAGAVDRWTAADKARSAKPRKVARKGKRASR